MLLTKNVIIKPEIFPVIGENNKLAREISKRFTKYYKRGVKNTNRKKILGYTLIVPKAFSKFESIYREDIMMLEVKINSKSSILIPSFYTSKNTLKSLFELSNNKKLSSIYSFDKDNFNVNILESIRILKEEVPDRVSASVKMDQEINLGKADHIKDFTRKFLINHYGDIGMAKFWNSLTGWDEKFAVGTVLKHSTSVFARFLRNVTRNWQGDNAFKDDKYQRAIAANDKQEMKRKTALLLKKMLTGDSDQVDNFIAEAIKIYDRPDNIREWLENLSTIDSKYLLAEEKEIFEAITTKFNISLDFGTPNIPDSIEDAREKNVTAIDKRNQLYIRSGILRFLFKGKIRRAINKLNKNWFGKGRQESYSVEDFDREIAKKIKKYTDDLDASQSKAATRELSEGLLGEKAKLFRKFILPATISVLCFSAVFGINPGTLGIETGLKEFERITPITAPSQTETREQLLQRGREAGEAAAKAAAEKENAKLLKRAEIAEKALERAQEGAKILEAIQGLGDRNVCKFLRDEGLDKIPGLPEDASKATKLHAKIFIEICDFTPANNEATYREGNAFEKAFEYTRAKKAGKPLPTLDDAAKEILEGILDINFQISLKKYNQLDPNNKTDNDKLHDIKMLFSYQLTDYQGGERTRYGTATESELGQFVKQATESVVEMKDLLDKAEEEAKKKNPNASEQEVLEAQRDASQDNALQNLSNDDIEDLVDLTIDKFKAIGEDASKRWEANIKTTDSYFVSIFREMTFLPLNIFITTMESVEGLVRDDPTFSEKVREFNKDKSNLNRTEALCGLFWILTIGGYFRRSNRDLGSNVRQIYEEIVFDQSNIFRIKPIQIAIQTIQMVCWASLSEEFKNIVEEVDDENDENKAKSKIRAAAKFTKEETAALSDLLNNLNGITAKKQIMSDGEKYVSALKQIEATTNQKVSIPVIKFKYTPPAKAS